MKILDCFGPLRAAYRACRYRLQRRLLLRRRKTDDLGRLGELLAAAYLRRQGMLIVAHSAKERLGEIDLVAVEGRQIVFVEVKTRSNPKLHDPAETIDLQKQTRLTRAARSFIGRHGLDDCSARFDVVSIAWPPDQRPAIKHSRNAFEAVGVS